MFSLSFPRDEKLFICVTFSNFHENYFDANFYNFFTIDLTTYRANDENSTAASKNIFLIQISSLVFFSFKRVLYLFKKKK